MISATELHYPQWTKEKPREEGWYWARHGTSRPFIERVTTVNGRLAIQQYDYARHDTTPYTGFLDDGPEGSIDMEGWEWAGPLKPPPEGR